MFSRRILSAVGVLAVLSLAGCKSTGDKIIMPAMVTVPAAGEYVSIEEVMVVVDASGSMWPGTSFAYAKALTQSMVQAFPEGSYNAGMMSFAGEWPFEWLNYGPVPFDRRVLTEAGRNLEFIAGSTPMDEALAYISDTYFSPSRNRALIILSDGKTPAQPLLDIAAQMASRGHLCIHTIQVGDDEYGARLLADLADTTPCGSYRHGDQIATETGMDAFIREVFFQDIAVIEVVGPDGARNVLGTVYFDTDKSFIRAGHEALLADIATRVKSSDVLRLRIEGNTDARASDQYNMALSMRRAQAVADRLIALGVDKDLITPVALGEGSPVAPNTTPQDRQLNRRVDVIAAD